MSESVVNKLYIGSLSKTVDESYLRKVLSDKEIDFGKLEVTSNGYAFADLPTDCNCDDIITKLNGLEIDGQSIKVELSTSKLVKRKVKNNKVVVHNFPDSHKVEEIKTYLNQYASVKSLDRANNRTPSKTSYIVTLNNMDDAERVLDKVNGITYEDALLKVVPFSENHIRRMRKDCVNALPHVPNPVYPFRFLVPTHLVGAIIGVGGNTVKKFQVESGARYIIVDVHQRDERYPHEKPVTVLGSADSQMTSLKTILDFLDDLLDQRAADAADTKKSSSSAEHSGEESSSAPSQGQEHDSTISYNSQSRNHLLGVVDTSDPANGPEGDVPQKKVHHGSIDLDLSNSDDLEFGSPDVITNGGELAETMPLIPAVFTTPLPVRILTHDHLVGRLIGKGGANLAGIKQDTDTKITIPSTSERNTFRAGLRDNYIERIITIEGERSKTLQAAEAMLCKLRSSYDKDMDYIMRSQENMQSLYPGSFNLQYLGAPLTPMMGGGPHGHGVHGGGSMGDMFPSQAAAAALAAAAQQRMTGPPMSPSHMSGTMVPGMNPAPPPGTMAFPPLANGFYDMQPDTQETTYLYIHHGAVGAIIGNRGTNIHMIKQLSMAQVTVDTQSDHQDQRRITITGSPEAQCKAQWLITEKLRTDGFTQGEWPILTCEIPIPLAMVGRIIGKQGKKVLELQRESHAIIEVPMGSAGLDNADTSSVSSGKSSSTTTGTGAGPGSGCDETIMVKVLGHYWALQSAQKKIRSIVHRQKSVSGENGGSKMSSQLLYAGLPSKLDESSHDSNNNKFS
jgi:RNA recognition motif-containing protein/transcription antitermination factor NusA-like protein